MLRNLSSQKIRDRGKELERFNTLETMQLLEQEQQQQRDRELELIRTQQVCPVNRLNSLQENLSGLRPEQFRHLLREEFYNAEMLSTLLCAVDSIYYSSNSGLAYNERIREWLLRLRQIGEESVYGYAMTASLASADDAFIVKAPRTTTGDDLQHELFIGMMGTNQLRKYVPNYAYIFGGFQCSPPLIDSQSHQVEAWCNNTRHSVNYVLYENVTPAISFNTYIRKASGTDFLNKYLQIVYALKKGEEVCDFTHYDLHDNNVLIRDIVGTRNLAIPYQTERGQMEYLLTDGIATMIDYGYSHINYQGRSYGQYRLVAGGVYPDRSFTLGDCYKLLAHATARALETGNQSVLTECTKLLRFFNTEETPQEIVQRQKATYFSIHWLPENTSATIDDFARYIRKVCACESFLVSKAPVDVKLLACKGSHCMRPQEALRLIGMTGSATPPQTVLQYYDLASRGKKVALSNKVAQKGLETMEIYLREALQRGRQLRPYHLKGSALTTILTPNTLFLFRKFVTDTAAIYDLLQRIEVLYRGYQLARERSSLNDDLWERIQRYYTFTGEIKSRLRIAVQRILEDTNYLRELRRDHTAKINTAIMADRSYNWYWDGIMAFFYMLDGTK